MTTPHPKTGEINMRVHGSEASILEAEAFYEKALEMLPSAESEYRALDEQTKTVLAACRPAEGTQAERDSAALRHNDYRAHLEAVSAARQDFLTAKARVQAMQARWETERSLLSAKKQFGK